jgi:hypothetical protein
MPHWRLLRTIRAIVVVFVSSSTFRLDRSEDRQVTHGACRQGCLEGVSRDKSSHEYPCVELASNSATDDTDSNSAPKCQLSKQMCYHQCSMSGVATYFGLSLTSYEALTVDRVSEGDCVAVLEKGEIGEVGMPLRLGSTREDDFLDNIWLSSQFFHQARVILDVRYHGIQSLNRLVSSWKASEIISSPISSVEASSGWSSSTLTQLARRSVASHR